jgi:hypothetical protein
MTVDPKIIDREIADLSIAAAKLERTIASVVEGFHHYVGDRRRYVGRTQVWGMTDAEAEERATAGTGVAPYDAQSLAMSFERRTAAQAELAKTYARMSELNAIFRAQPWSRFFLVRDGHIHASQACHTCRVTTEFGWLPDLSGETEAQAVAAHGALLCTVCYPSAPVEWTNHYEALEAAKKAASCPGSAKGYDPTRPHELRQMSKWGYCTGCGTRQTVTSTGKIRTHKKG